jgi:hypothetical protein
MLRKTLQTWQTVRRNGHVTLRLLSLPMSWIGMSWDKRVHQSVLWTDWQPGMCPDSDEDWKGDCHHIRKLPVEYNKKVTSWPNPEPFQMLYNWPMYHPLWQVLPFVPWCPKVFQLTNVYIPACTQKVINFRYLSGGTSVNMAPHLLNKCHWIISVRGLGEVITVVIQIMLCQMATRQPPVSRRYQVSIYLSHCLSLLDFDELWPSNSFQSDCGILL